VERARRVYQKLRETYPDAECALKHNNAYELLVATILSAQCTDERVNKTTPELFAKYPTPKDLAESKQEDVEQIIRSCGFYRNKTKSIRAAAQDITEKFNGEVPQSMEELTSLQGVARKTANVILGTAFGINEGVVVDTHVKRLAHRLGFTEQTNTDRIERDLMNLFPREWWDMLAHLLIWHGRQICTARKPDCENCPLNDDCPKIGVTATRTG
jgi:endonuclease-3